MNSIQEQSASTWATGNLWLIVVFIGAFVLIAAMAWARAQNLKRTPKEERETEEATRRLYQEQNRDDDLADR